MKSNEPIKPNVHLETPLFKEAVKSYVNEFDIKRVVETGTHDGTGSTKIFADLGLEVHTCEVWEKQFLLAQKEHENNPNVFCYNAHTMTKDDGNFIRNRNLKKLEEHPDKELWLEEMVKSKGFDGTAYFLDSDWTMGFREFSLIYRYSLEQNNNWTLILDDATNLKHRPTLKYIKDYDLATSIEEKERWAILRF